MSDIITIHKIERHHWPSCPCDVCGRERKDRKAKSLLESRQIQLTPNQAYRLGFIPSLSPFGSKARAIRAAEYASQTSEISGG